MCLKTTRVKVVKLAELTDGTIMRFQKHFYLFYSVFLGIFLTNINITDTLKCYDARNPKHVMGFPEPAKLAGFYQLEILSKIILQRGITLDQIR